MHISEAIPATISRIERPGPREDTGKAFKPSAEAGILVPPMKGGL